MKTSYYDYFASQALLPGYTSKEGGQALPIYYSPVYQGGRGFGDFFRRVTSFVKSIFKSVAPTIGKELLSAGSKIAVDALSGKNIGASARENLSQAGESLREQAINKLQEGRG